ncbi:MAG: ATP/GTP-binding protein [Candidatus Bathyarchaeia archaeon]
MDGIFIVGTAGSGKSLLSAALAEWLAAKKISVSVVNLDPGAPFLPYEPQIDVRENIRVEELMERYHLGPNGAIIMAADLIAGEVERINDKLAELGTEYAIFDTPGQIELFAFRASSPYLLKELKLQQKLIIYLFDAVFCSNPLNYMSNLFLSVAVYNRFILPQLNLLSKVDLTPKEKVDEILSWGKKPDVLTNAIARELNGSTYLLAQDIVRAIMRLRLDFSLIPCSARYLDNFINVHAAIQRVLRRGEEC